MVTSFQVTRLARLSWRTQVAKTAHGFGSRAKSPTPPSHFKILTSPKAAKAKRKKERKKEREREKENLAAHGARQKSGRLASNSEPPEAGR
jgi:hypothetical protein